MAHDKDKDHSHAENPGAGTDGSTPESAEKSTDAIGAEQSKTKGKVKGVLGRLWDGVKLFAEKVGYVTGALEHPDDRAEGHAEEPHEKGHEKEHEKPHAEKPHAEAPKKEEPKPAQPDNDEGAPAVPEGTEAPTTAEDSNGPEEPAPVTPAEAKTPKDESPKKDEKEGDHGGKHDAEDAHGAHAKKGMGNGTKAALIATGIAGATVVASTALVANATVELAGSVIEHGPKWLQTAGNLVKWPFRATGRFVGNLAGTPVAELKDGFDYGANEFVGEADYEELEGWTAPWKAVKNVGRSLVRNPITRTVAGASFGALGFLGGIFKGGIEGGVDAFSEENKPTFEMPWKRTKKPKEKKAKKPKKVKADAHGHGGDSHGHGKDAHGHGNDEHKDAHAKPAEAGHGNDEHKDAHAKPAEAEHKEAHAEPAHAEAAAHHRTDGGELVSLDDYRKRTQTGKGDQSDRLAA